MANFPIHRACLSIGWHVHSLPSSQAYYSRLYSTWVPDQIAQKLTKHWNDLPLQRPPANRCRLGRARRCLRSLIVFATRPAHAPFSETLVSTVIDSNTDSKATTTSDTGETHRSLSRHQTGTLFIGSRDLKTPKCRDRLPCSPSHRILIAGGRS